MEVIFTKDNQTVKKPQHLNKNIFIIFSPKTVTVEAPRCTKIDTKIVLNLPKKAKAFLASKFRGHGIYEINNNENRLWIQVLNTSYTEDLKIDRNTPLGFLVIEPESLKSKYETKKKPKKKKGLPKNWEETRKAYWKKKKSPKRGVLQQV